MIKNYYQALRRVPIVKLLNNMFNGSFSLKSGRLNLQWHIRVVSCLVGRRTSSLTRAVRHFILRFRQIAGRNGIVFLVKYLKACHVLTMQAVGGMKIPATQRLGCAVSRTNAGLPRVIPSWWRSRIRGGDRLIIRVTLTLFSVYRILEYAGKPKLSTITSPGKDLSGLWNKIRRETGLFWASRPIKLTQESFQATLFPISKAGASSTKMMDSQVATSLAGIVNGACLWRESPLLSAFTKFAGLGGNMQLVEYIHRWSREGNPFLKMGFRPHLGRLGFKQEAAGKVRVFAMVDCFTNWLLRPLHDAIFQYLRKIPQDGTFNQHAPVHTLLNSGKTKFWCYDLSAATDRLPVDLQVEVLAPVIGREMALAWKELLVGRIYHSRYGDVSYAVGQPMGALSSWAMLALTHHFIIQWAAREALASVVYSETKGSWKDWWFQDYAVLGDDIVIANGRVARQYVKIMSDLGVGIGFEKSLISRNGCLEFAKKFYVRQDDCSPLPYKEFMAARGSVMALVEFALKYKLRIGLVMDVRGYGYRAKARLGNSVYKIPRKMRNLLLTIYAPVKGSTLLSSWVELSNLATRETHGYNWTEVLREYIAYRFDGLRTALEARRTQWDAFAEQFVHKEVIDVLRMKLPGIKISFDMQNIRSGGDFRPTGAGEQAGPELSSSLRSEIGKPLYLGTVERSIRPEMDLIRSKLEVLNALGECKFITGRLLGELEGIHAGLEELDKRVSALAVPPSTECRDGGDEDHLLFRQPIKMANLWVRLNAALRSPPIDRVWDRAGSNEEKRRMALIDGLRNTQNLNEILSNVDKGPKYAPYGGYTRVFY